MLPAIEAFSDDKQRVWEPLSFNKWKSMAFSIMPSCHNAMIFEYSSLKFKRYFCGRNTLSSDFAYIFELAICQYNFASLPHKLPIVMYYNNGLSRKSPFKSIFQRILFSILLTDRPLKSMIFNFYFIIKTFLSILFAKFK